MVILPCWRGCRSISLRQWQVQVQVQGAGAGAGLLRCPAAGCASMVTHASLHQFFQHRPAYGFPEDPSRYFAGF